MTRLPIPKDLKPPKQHLEEVTRLRFEASTYFVSGEENGLIGIGLAYTTPNLNECPLK